MIFMDFTTKIVLTNLSRESFIRLANALPTTLICYISTSNIKLKNRIDEQTAMFIIVSDNEIG